LNRTLDFEMAMKLTAAQLRRGLHNPLNTKPCHPLVSEYTAVVLV